MKKHIAKATVLSTICCWFQSAYAETHQWKLPVLSALEYRTAFVESGKQHAAFMLCNAPGRMRCEDADDELSYRFSTDICKELYYVALVDGRGSGYGVLHHDFKVVFAIKSATGVWPIQVSTPEEDTTLVDCRATARAARN